LNWVIIALLKVKQFITIK